jgi:hypothetical protein
MEPVSKELTSDLIYQRLQELNNEKQFLMK